MTEKHIKTTLELEINEQTLRLSREEAERLCDELNALLGRNNNTLWIYPGTTVNPKPPFTPWGTYINTTTTLNA